MTLRRLGPALCCLVVALVLGVPGAAAAATAQGGPSFLRLAHLSPDTPNVDVYLTAVDDPARSFTLEGVGYGAVSDYRSLPAGTYTVAMRSAGAPADAPPVIATTLTTEPGEAYTVAGTGLYDELGLTVLVDDLTMPEPGQARLRVINAAATAPQVDLAVAGGPVIAEGVGFAESSGYRTVPIGSWTVNVSTPGGGAPTSLPVDVAANAVYTVLLLDTGGRLTAQLHLDSAGAPAVPLGGIHTGFGGTAGGWGGLEWLLLAAAAVAAAALVGRLRRASSR
ncbi:DUF4397 domain-containing protein [Pseudonocardia nigra]|uniref:DUF4397 domain-containing protein n=1 Tax=Pseudonocardia nigra TaxID=1921578 RepID=UPI001C6005CD|nr:DUF4397 domain-containing protein [Pseudonocardia nigra]